MLKNFSGQQMKTMIGCGFLQPIKMQNYGIQSPMDIPTKSSFIQGIGDIEEEGQKNCKSQRIWKVDVRLCLLVKSEATHKRFHQYYY